MSNHLTFKLYASLGQYLPAGAVDNKATIELTQDESLADLIERFDLPERLVHLVLVDGVFVPPEDRAARILQDGETVAIWPPVAGG
jgi:sulfur carrier protein ThiS